MQQFIPCNVWEYLAEQFGFTTGILLLDETQHKTSLHRHRAAVRVYLCSKPYSRGGRKRLNQLIDEAAETMSDPADLINIAVEELFEANIELPAFSTLESA